MKPKEKPKRRPIFSIIYEKTNKMAVSVVLGYLGGNPAGIEAMPPTASVASDGEPNWEFSWLFSLSLSP